MNNYYYKLTFKCHQYSFQTQYKEQSTMINNELKEDEFLKLRIKAFNWMNR